MVRRVDKKMNIALFPCKFSILMTVSYCTKVPLRPKDMRALKSEWPFLALLLTTVVVGGLRLNVIFAALQLSPMSIVHTVLSGSPVLVMALSHLLLNRQDPFSGMKALASVLLIAGVVLNANPMSAINDVVSSSNHH